MQIQLGWGRSPIEVELPDDAQVVKPPALGDGGALRGWRELTVEALANPIGSAPLEVLLARGRRICVVIPDRTRKPVPEAVLRVLRQRLAGCQVEVWAATGKHPQSPHGDARVHDAFAGDLVKVGVTEHGTEVSYPADVLRADLRILVGEIRPHYFAGWAGGGKTLFPGLAGAAGIWRNHEMKAADGARLGVLEGNPCRADLEAAAAMAGPSVILNIVRGPHGTSAHGLGAVYGDPVAAHRAGAALARQAFTTSVASRTEVVVVSDRHPVTSNLYQACKLLPPAGAMLSEGGLIVLAAECHEGIGPVDVINHGIYRLGVVCALPRRHRVALVSSQRRAAVEPTFADWAPSVEEAIAGASAVSVMPYAADIIVVTDDTRCARA